MSRTQRIAAVLAAAGIALAGCSSGTEPPAASSSPPPATASAGAVAADPAMEHIHNLALHGETLLLGSHHGLWEQQAGRPAAQVSEPFDVMGFALDGETYLASGHPGEGMDAPADLGLLRSTDGGRTWQTVGLSGEVDFHRLVASGDTILGVDSGDGTLRRSTDAGKTWANLGAGPFDIALDPGDPDRVVGTTPEGPVVSTDGGRKFTPIKDAPLMAFVSWDRDELGGIAPDGTIYASTDRGRSWRHVGHVAGEPAAFTMAGKHIVVLTGDTILESRDGGATFAPRVTGVTT